MSRRMVRSVTPCSSASADVVVWRPASLRLTTFRCRITSAVRMDQEPLPELDAQAGQRVTLLLALDALGDHPRADLLAQHPKRVQEAALDAALVDVADQAGIELQEVRLDRGQRLERRVPCPHVVHRHPIA